MYCIKCGVELEQGAERCPLCGLRVYHPELSETPGPRSYPHYSDDGVQIKRTGLPFILTFLHLIPLVICLLVDFRMSGGVSWSGYAVGGILVLYTMICLPLWFRNPNPVIFFPITGVSILLLSLYVSLKTGGRWFLPFAFPVGGALIIIIETVIVLIRYTVRQKSYRILYILGGAYIALGALCMLIEFLLHITFGIKMSWWCLYPLSVMSLLGIALLLTAICPPLRSSLHKAFFI